VDPRSTKKFFFLQFMRIQYGFPDSGSCLNLVEIGPGFQSEWFGQLVIIIQIQCAYIFFQNETDFRKHLSLGQTREVC
jgi:hypothetical protein